MIKDDLQRIKEGLKKEIGLGRFVRELGEVIEHMYYTCLVRESYYRR